MDIYHTGREDKEDDHKFVNERLLEVAIPSDEEADKVITLEDCLETYFNNRIEVKRHLQRQNTLKSRHGTISSASTPDTEKGNTMHIETIEVVESPTVATPTSPFPPTSPARPIEGRRRADSIFSERYVKRQKSTEKSAFDEKRLLEEILDTSGGRPRASSLRKEVLMPAWQFFSLIRMSLVARCNLDLANVHSVVHGQCSPNRRPSSSTFLSKAAGIRYLPQTLLYAPRWHTNALEHLRGYPTRNWTAPFHFGRSN